MSDYWLDPGLNVVFHFDENGLFVDDNGMRLRDHPNKFKNDDNFCQWVHSYVQRKMEQDGMKMMLAPEENGSPIWYSSNAFNSPEKLLVIICGDGKMRAGMLSVGASAYYSLDFGSDLPWIKFARENGMEVVILNPNHLGSERIKEKYNTEMRIVKHSLYVFDKLIIPSNPKNVFIMAFSAGGYSVCGLMNNFQSWYMQHVKFTALADTVEDKVVVKSDVFERYLDTRCINWVKSQEPLDKKLKTTKLFRHRSANTNSHSLCPPKARPCIFKKFEQFMA